MPRFAQTFVQDMPKYLTESAIFEKGTFVVLNTGEIGEVIDYRYPQTLRPVVNIYITAKKQIVRYPIPINLESDDTRTIENVFENDAMINKLIEAKSKIHKRNNNNNNMNSEKKDVAQQKEEDLNKLNNKQITIDKDLIEEDEGSLK